ncbi:MAG: 4Fe-4S binding protein [Thermodesulfobacteriota bacterium]|nr:4Fe-4S binding protein [Thermodesulfobacteriota bacterium]
MTDTLYYRIAEAVEESIQGAPKVGGKFSQAFISYLKLVYTEKEAELVQHLAMPSKFKSAQEIAEVSGRDVHEVKEILEAVSRKRGILSVNESYCLPAVPGLLNIHQGYREVRPGDEEASKLYQQFFIQEGYYKYYETSEKGTPWMRTIPVERTIEKGEKILIAEEAHALISNLNTEDLVLNTCPCRTRTEKLGIRECKDKYPIGSCIIIGLGAQRLESLGMGKRVTKQQAIQYLDEMQKLGLVAATENYKTPDPTLICLCCECCCSQVRGRTRWDNPSSLLPSNFIPHANEACTMCGACVDRCFFGALTLDEEAGKVVANSQECIGCGVCTIKCPQEALKLCRYERTTSFETSKELYKTIARENKGV